jgi:hypothetical protein
MMTAKSKLICLQNIDTYFREETENIENAERIVAAEASKKSRITSLVAEETEKGEIILIEKFQYFAALKRIDSNLRVPCFVYPRTSEKERLIHILKVSMPLEKDMSWLFYHMHVMGLVNDHKMTPEEIAKCVNITYQK